MSNKRKDYDSLKPAFTFIVGVMRWWNTKPIVFFGPKVLSIKVHSKLLKHFTSVCTKNGRRKIFWVRG